MHVAPDSDADFQASEYSLPGMSGDTLSLLALFGSLLLIGAIWLTGRRMDRLSEERYKALPPRVEPRPERVVTVAEAVGRAVEELKTAKRLLDEVYTIGLWSKSDDCSDNRRKRQGLRETDWAVSGAQRAVASIAAPLRDERLDALEADLRALVARIEPLPDTVTDTMGDNLALDSTVSSLSDEVERLQEWASLLAAEAKDQGR
jgi:hypothetical protein